VKSIRQAVLLVGAGATCGVALGLFGCAGSASPAAARRETSAFKTLTLAYMQFVRDHKGQLPRDDQAFRSYVEKTLANFLSQSDMTVDEVFRSPRDGEPYVFFSQQKPPPGGSDVVGFEQQGVEGSRYVGDRTGTVLEVDEAEFAALGLTP
jgi:hypothetical protein